MILVVLNSIRTIILIAVSKLPAHVPNSNQTVPISLRFDKYSHWPLMSSRLHDVIAVKSHAFTLPESRAEVQCMTGEIFKVF